MSICGTREVGRLT
jgi:hypothetical protein